MSIRVGTYNPQNYYHNQGYSSSPSGYVLTQSDYYSNEYTQPSVFEVATDSCSYVPSWLYNTDPNRRETIIYTPVSCTDQSYVPSKDCYDTNRITYYDNLIGFRGVKRRVTANKKERRRTESINSAFAQLRGCIPNVPLDTKLSKIKTLRLATSYITYLMDLLSRDDPVLENTFKADIQRKSEIKHRKTEVALTNQINNAKLERDVEISSRRDKTSDDNHVIERRSKGRTGWPQDVWASELK